MNPSLSQKEAAAALAEVDQARLAMRQAIRNHRGHQHLWIWGAVWIAMPLTAYFGGDHAARYFIWICLAGGLLSAAAGFALSRQVRRPVNGRLIGMFLAVWGFAAAFPFVLQVSGDVRSLYAYLCLVAMMTYVIAGLWTDTYLLWVGLAVAALILVGYFLFPSLFWLWMAVFGGGSLVLTGFYIRSCWR